MQSQNSAEAILRIPKEVDTALERHYSVDEVAKIWGLSRRTIQRIFGDEPGVVCWGNSESRFKRGYITLRIPESVVQRVHRRLRKTC
jgi:AraC-like DNA-binding protein